MLSIPSSLQTQFEACLRNKKVPNRTHASYKKWLRFYLDFCLKYHFSPTRRESLSYFLGKLQEKVTVQQHPICTRSGWLT